MLYASHRQDLRMSKETTRLFRPLHTSLSLIKRGFHGEVLKGAKWRARQR